MPLGKYFYIKSKMHGQVLDVCGACGDPGSKVIMFHQKPLEDSTNQLWYIDYLAGVIRTKINDFCLDAEDRLTLEPYDPDHDSQQWEISGELIQRRKDDQRVLDVVGREAAECTEVCCWNRHGEENQLWEYEHVPVEKYFYIRSELHGKVLDIKHRESEPDSKVVMWEREDGVESQLWYENQAGVIASKVNDCVLDSSKGKIRLQSHQPDDPDQLWIFSENRIVNRSNPDHALDIKGAKTKDGAKLLSYEWHGGDNQRFALDPE